MRCPWLFVVLVVGLLFSGCQKKQAQSPVPEPAKPTVAPLAQNVDTILTAAVSRIENSEVSQGVLLLLDAIMATRPTELWPNGFVQTIAVCRDHFQKNDFRSGGEAASRALATLGFSANPASPQGTSATSGQIPPLAERVKAGIVAAKEEFKKGNADDGVVIILQTLQMLAPK